MDQHTKIEIRNLNVFAGKTQILKNVNIDILNTTLEGIGRCKEQLIRKILVNIFEQSGRIEACVGKQAITKDFRWFS